MPYAIDLKHDSAHRTWKRLSVMALKPERLIAESDQYAEQYAAFNQMNGDQIAVRVVEISSSQIGSAKPDFVSVVYSRESNASANRPQKRQDGPGSEVVGEPAAAASQGNANDDLKAVDAAAENLIAMLESGASHDPNSVLMAAYQLRAACAHAVKDGERLLAAQASIDDLAAAAHPRPRGI